PAYPQGGGALRRPDGCAGRERCQAAGTRACQSRQCPGPPWDDPTRLALSAVSKEQRNGPVVPGPHGRSPWRHAQNNDRRHGAQAAHRTLAICHHWRAIGRRHPASGKLTNLWRIISLPARRSLLASTTGTAGRQSEVAGTGRRRGTDADKENGPAARSFAADAHDCIMVRIQTDLPNTSVRREAPPQWRAPLGLYPDKRCQAPQLDRSPSPWSSSLRVLR